MDALIINSWPIAETKNTIRLAANLFIPLFWRGKYRCPF
jgi:hypothetical protein